MEKMSLAGYTFLMLTIGIVAIGVICYVQDDRS